MKLLKIINILAALSLPIMLCSCMPTISGPWEKRELTLTDADTGKPIQDALVCYCNTRTDTTITSTYPGWIVTKCYITDKNGHVELPNYHQLDLCPIFSHYSHYVDVIFARDYYYNPCFPGAVRLDIDSMDHLAIKKFSYKPVNDNGITMGARVLLSQATGEYFKLSDYHKAAQILSQGDIINLFWPVVDYRIKRMLSFIDRYKERHWWFPF